MNNEENIMESVPGSDRGLDRCRRNQKTVKRIFAVLMTVTVVGMVVVFVLGVCAVFAADPTMSGSERLGLLGFVIVEMFGVMALCFEWEFYCDLKYFLAPPSERTEAKTVVNTLAAFFALAAVVTLTFGVGVIFIFLWLLTRIVGVVVDIVTQTKKSILPN